MASTNILRYGKVQANDFSMSYILSNKDKEKNLEKIQLFFKKEYLCGYIPIVHVKHSKMLCKAYKLKFHTPFIEINDF